MLRLQSIADGIGNIPAFFAENSGGNPFTYARIRDQAALSWVHVDDFLIVAAPHIIETLRDILISRLNTAGFTINYKKSQLQPVCALNYLGLRLNLEKRYFTLDWKHISTFKKLADTDLANLSVRLKECAWFSFFYVILHCATVRAH